MSNDQETTERDRITAWLRGRLPEEWTATEPEVTVDREEVTVVLALPKVPQDPDETAGSVSRFREDTRGARMRVAEEAGRRFGRTVSWGVRAGERTHLFTTLSVPVMTRLRQPERLVLDTLVDGGVARSRAQALAWCVRLVGERSESWLGELRGAMEAVEKVRRTGPSG